MPLWGLDVLASVPDATVLVVEGEKTALAAQALFPDLAVVTSGSSSRSGSYDWSPLRGRKVVIWPDADEPGDKYAQSVSDLLEGLADAVQVVSVPRAFPSAWDLADELPNGWTVESLRELIEPRTPSPQVPSTTPSRALRVQSVGEVLSAPARPREWLWEGYIPLGREGMVAALSDVGKTAFHLQLAVAVATGRPLFWIPTRPEPSGVLFMTYEDDPADDFRERLTWVKETYPEWSPADDALLDKNLLLADPTWDLDCSISGIQAEVEQVLAKMTSRGTRPALLIIETLASVTEGDGNSDDSTRKVWDVVRAIRKRHGVTVSLAHHHRKPSNEEARDPLSQLDPRKARGTGGNEGAARWMIQLAAIPHDRAEGLGLDPVRAMKGAYALIGATKVKADRPDPLVLERLGGEFPGRHCWSRRPDGERIFANLLSSKKVKAELDNRERVGLAVLELGSDATKAEVVTRTRLDDRAVESAATALRGKNLLEVQRSPYVLTPAGLDWAQGLKRNASATQADAFDGMLMPARVSNDQEVPNAS